MGNGMKHKQVGCANAENLPEWRCSRSRRVEDVIGRANSPGANGRHAAEPNRRKTRIGAVPRTES